MKFIRINVLLIVLSSVFVLSSYAPASEEIPEPATQSGAFLWYELVTPDITVAKNFYGDVFGWTFQDIPDKGLKVTTIYREGKAIGGMIEVPSAQTSVWIKTVRVANIKQSVMNVKTFGGKVMLPPLKLPGIGILGVLEGPQGEEFSMVENPDLTGVSSGGGENNWVWSELWAGTPDQAKEFYEKVFLVTTEDNTYDDKPYWVFKSGTENLAGMIQNPVGNQGSRWVPYIMSSALSDVAGKVSSGGGIVLLGPDANVRNGNVVILQDPQGAVFCVQNKLN